MENVKNKTLEFVPDKQLIENAIDQREKETGVFHWQLPSKEYKPLDQMTDQEIDGAVDFASGKLEYQHRLFERSYTMMHVWARRLTKVMEEQHKREELKEISQGEIA